MINNIKSAEYMAKKILKYIISIIVVSTVIILLFSRKNPEEKFYPKDYQGIIESGVIKAVTEYNALSYYIFKGETYGFDYEVLSAFAKEKGIKLEMTPEMSFEKRIKGVIEGRYDMIALGTATTSQLKDSILFTNPFAIGKQILIQRNDEDNRIDSPLGLAGKIIHIIKDSPALMRINNLMDEIGDSIYIEEITDYGPEQLLAMVSAGDIDYAVCDERTAKMYMRRFKNLDLNTNISFNQFYSWGVNRNAPILLDSINSWLERYIKTKEYKDLYNEYFKRNY